MRFNISFLLLLSSDLVTPEQVGFLPGHGVEHNHFSLFESIRQCWREKNDVYLLFVDLRKAFDTANHALIYAVLRRMGIPDDHIRALKTLNALRRTRIRINGALSPEIPYETGTPQGDPLSPKIFNLLVQALSRKLNNSPSLRGISFRGRPGVLDAEAIIRHLFYADDLVIIGTSRAEIAVAANVVEEWCGDWGFSIATGKRKTNAMFMPFKRPSGIASTPLAPPDDPSNILTAKGLEILWTDEYRFLGITVDQRLSLGYFVPPQKGIDTATSHRPDGSSLRNRFTTHPALANITRMGSAFAKNIIIRKFLSLKTKLQLNNNATASAINFAAGVMPLHLGTCEAIDVQARTNVRRLMRLHKGFPNAILVAEAALGYTAMSMRKQQERLLNTLSDPDGISGLARDVLACTAHFLTFDHTGATPATEYKGPEFARPWTSTIEQDRRAYKQRGIHTLSDIPGAPGMALISRRLATFRTAGNYAMQFAMINPSSESQQQYALTPMAVNPREASRLRDERLHRRTTGGFFYPGSALPYFDPRTRPNPSSPSLFFFDLVFHQRADPLDVVPHARILMNAAYYGADGASVAALSTIPHLEVRFISLAKLGAQSLSHPPFVDRHAVAGHNHSPLACRFCAGDSGPDGTPHASRDSLGQRHADIYHLLSGCSTGAPDTDSIRSDHALAVLRMDLAACTVEFIYKFSTLLTSTAAAHQSRTQREDMQQLACLLRHWAYATIPHRDSARKKDSQHYWVDTADGRFLIFRLIIGCQFQSIHLRSPTGDPIDDLPISSLFASLLEHTLLTSAQLTPIMNLWAAFSVKQLKKLGACWIEAAEATTLEGPEPPWDVHDVWGRTMKSISRRRKLDMELSPPPPVIPAHFRRGAAPPAPFYSFNSPPPSPRHSQLTDEYIPTLDDLWDDDDL